VGRFFLFTDVAQNIGLLFPELWISFDNQRNGLCFRQFFHKLIWSPWIRFRGLFFQSDVNFVDKFLTKASRVNENQKYTKAILIGQTHPVSLWRAGDAIHPLCDATNPFHSALSNLHFFQSVQKAFYLEAGKKITFWCNNLPEYFRRKLGVFFSSGLLIRVYVHKLGRLTYMQGWIIFWSWFFEWPTNYFSSFYIQLTFFNSAWKWVRLPVYIVFPHSCFYLSKYIAYWYVDFCGKYYCYLSYSDRIQLIFPPYFSRQFSLLTPPIYLAQSASI
jgi:hypothetical protein